MKVTHIGGRNDPFSVKYQETWDLERSDIAGTLERSPVYTGTCALKTRGAKTALLQSM